MARKIKLSEQKIISDVDFWKENSAYWKDQSKYWMEQSEFWRNKFCESEGINNNVLATYRRLKIVR